MLQLDLTALPPAHHARVLTDALDALAPGEAFTFRCDHDPAPLYYRCDRTRPGLASWQYLQAGPVHWVVRVVRR